MTYANEVDGWDCGGDLCEGAVWQFCDECTDGVDDDGNECAICTGSGGGFICATHVERTVMTEWYCENCRKVFHAHIPQCCGSVVRFDMADHGRTLVSNSNAWISVWNKWRDHPAVRQVAKEWAADGNCSAAGILNDTFDRMDNTDACGRFESGFQGLARTLEHENERLSTDLLNAKDELDKCKNAIILFMVGMNECQEEVRNLFKTEIELAKIALGMRSS